MIARLVVTALVCVAAMGCGSSPTTPPPLNTSAPSASSGAATSVTTTSATVNGTTTPNGLATDVFFEWGTTAAYGNATPAQQVSNGTAAVSVTAPISGLTPGTAYNFRLVARNSAGTTNGANQTFTTISAPSGGAVPAVTTAAPNGIGPDHGKLNGTVKPNGLPTEAFFEWGRTNSYGNTTEIQQVGDGNSDVALTATISGLLLNETYHYRLVARNSAGSASGTNQTFTTLTPPPPGPGLPTATTQGVTNIEVSRATLHGTVTPNGLATEVWFQWGLDGDPGVFIESMVAIGSGDVPVNVSREANALAANRTYRYRVLARNSAGTVMGEFLTFQSSAAPVAVTRAAANIGTTSATIRGSIEPRGLDTDVFFEWGTSTSYGNIATAPMVPSGNSSVTREVAITGLSPNTTYHYRVVARSSGGTTTGANVSLVTASSGPGGSPAVTIRPASRIFTDSAELTGTINPNGLPTEAFFEWGPVSGAGFSNSTPVRSYGSGTELVEVEASITGLTPATTYRYRLVGRNSAGTSITGTGQFTTDTGK